MQDPFEILGMPAGMDIDPDALEARYLELSRSHHPDHVASECPLAQVEILHKSAAINDAYNCVRDPWTRAEALIRRANAEAMAANKSLCPLFLMEAMELRERVLEDPESALTDLDRELDAKMQSLLKELAGQLAANHPNEAATLLHQSNYYRKARADLRQRLEAAS